MKLSLDGILELGMYGLSARVFKEHGDKIDPFLESFKNRDQDFQYLPKLNAAFLASKQTAEKFEGKFENIVILGIGGSALGITCLRDALKGPYWNLHGKPRLFVLDNLDLVAEIEKVIDPDKTLFIVISKSGSTPETMAQLFYFLEKVGRDHFVFITDPDSGVLREMGKELRLPMLDIPKKVGGRFSVLSPVGLFPAALLGLDIEELLRGADDMVKSFENSEWDLNLPFQFATIQYLLEWKHGIPMTVLMPYSSRLFSLADWYRQLLAESIGKNGKGLTPIPALGVTDQHSQLQLYNEGPTDKLIAFLEVENESSPLIPKIETPSLSYLSGHSFHELMTIEKQGTEQGLKEYKKPTLTLKIPEVNAYELGQLFMFFEASIAFLGEYYRINAFDQPGVELSKKLTKKLLST